MTNLKQLIMFLFYVVGFIAYVIGMAFFLMILLPDWGW